MDEEQKIVDSQEKTPQDLAPAQKTKSKPIIYVIIFVVIALVLSTLYALISKTQNVTKGPFDNGGLVNRIIEPTKTPDPFEDLTIPYLRNRIYESSIGELKISSENLSYTSYLTSYLSDGLNVNGQLTIPKGNKPVNGWPAIIFIHGYIPPASYQTMVNYVSYVDYLARNGFVVFKVDLRGHGNSEGDPSGAYYSSDYIIDVLNARAALQTQESVDKDNIGLWGHSMAGNIVLRTVAAKPEIPAAVIWAGAVYSYEDWEKYGIDDGSYRPPVNDEERQRKREQLFNTHGEFSTLSPFWKQVAATNYLTDYKGAIQLNHAVDDNVVDIGYSRDLAKLLDETNVTHELKEYSSGGHNLSGSAFNQAMQNTVDFFKMHLE